MPLFAGNRLGPYEILAPIGAGGMGEVYKARDTRLDRIVAIKVLPEHIAQRKDLRERFEREARTVAFLNHPNICVLHDIGNQDGVGYMVMEYIEGETLAACIQRRLLPIGQTLKLAAQAADALNRAHRAGVTHRDVKPANIMLTRDGVKVLDFGLAKSLTNLRANEETRTAPLTEEGSILGTPQYMAPELYEGREADERSDIFAFGCVLYEMVTGKRAFDARTRAGLVAAVQGAEPPPIASLNPTAPLALEKMIRRCLAKDPENRYFSLHDLLLDLHSIGEAAADPPGKQRGPGGGWLAAAMLISAVSGIGFMYIRARPLDVPLVRLSLLPPQAGRFTTAMTGVPHLAVSPDGKHLVVAATASDGKDRLWVRPLDSTVARALEGTEGAIFPFWSADSQSIAFFASGKLKRIAAAGGPPVPLADAPIPRGGAWSETGDIVFSPGTNGPLWRVSATGGPVSPVTKLDAAAGETSHRVPSFLPDRTHFLYAVWKVGTNQVAIRIGSLDSLDVSQPLQDANSSAVYAQGQLLFMRGNTLMARPFDAKRRAFVGEAVPAASPVQASISAPGALAYSVSSTGWLVYAGGNANDSRLTWFSRTGERRGVLGDPGNLIGARFSPDRKKVAVTIADGGSNDIWIYDVQRGMRTRLTSDPALDDNPVWSPDGGTLVFRSNRKGIFGLYRTAADGSGAEQSFYEDSANKFPISFSPDRKFLAYQTFGDPKTGNDIWVLPDALGERGQSKPFPFVRSEFLEAAPQFSPDGNWIAYQSNESGRNEIYATPFPGPGGKRQVSTAGGADPCWRPDGKELFYKGENGRLMAARIEMKAGSIEVGKIEALFSGLTGAYDVSIDGQQILAVAPPEDKVQEPLTVVQNWTSGLKR